MNKISHVLLAFFLYMFAFMVTNAESADTSANETAKELMAAAEQPDLHPWNASVDMTWLPASDIRKTGGNIVMEEVETKFGRNYNFSPEFSLSTDFAYSFRKLDAPDSARLPEELHTLSLNLGGNYQLNNKTTLTFLAEPSLNGDFKEIGTDDIRTQLGIMGRYGMSQKLILLAGVIYRQGYKYIPVLPVIGAIYRPDEQWTLSLAAPRPGVAYSPSQTSRYYIGGEFAGTEYQLHDASLGAKIISYRDFRALAGAEYVLFSSIKVNIAGGYAFDRKFVFYDGSRDDVDIDDGPFARLGVSLVW
ncbi:MAG: hypothetical protein FD174_1380 [Geobacteraceae bacterium]|nr:MAG: hypothetical protein FD174_1380 [Geobacteraceae bacterium]